MVNPFFFENIKRIFTYFKLKGYYLDIMRQIAYLFFFNPVMVENYDFLLNCTTVGQVSDSVPVQT